MAQFVQQDGLDKYPTDLKDLYKLCHQNFVEFVNDYNVKKTAGLLKLDDDEQKALKALHGMWKRSKIHFKTKDMDYFFKMKDHHTVLNRTLIYEQPIETWKEYINSGLAFRT